MYVVIKETGEYSDFDYEVIGAFEHEDSAERCFGLLEYERSLKKGMEVRLIECPPKDGEYADDESVERMKSQLRDAHEADRTKRNAWFRKQSEERERQAAATTASLNAELWRGLDDKYRVMRRRFGEGDTLEEVRHFIHRDAPYVRQLERDRPADAHVLEHSSFVKEYGDDVIRPLARQHIHQLSTEDFRAMLDLKIRV